MACALSTGSAVAAVDDDEEAGPDAPAAWAAPATIDRFLQERRSDLLLAGLAVVVIADGEVRFSGAYGDGGSNAPEIMLDTPFVLGSTSKQFTGLVVQRLIVDGLLGLDDTLAVLAPDLLAEDAGPFGAVTISQLLSHRSGLGEAAGLEQWGIGADPGSIQLEAARVLATDPVSAPGEAYRYSNANYTVLGAVIEKVTRTSYERALQHLVLRPLGMTVTTSDVIDARGHGLAAGHYTWFGVANIVTSTTQSAAGAPSSSIMSSANDLTRLLQAHLGTSDVGDLEVALAAAREPIDVIDTDAAYASGWVVRPFTELADAGATTDAASLPRLWEHHGDSARSVSYLAFAPDLGLGVVLLSNTGDGIDQSRLPALTSDLLHTIAGTPPPERTADPLIAAAPVLMIAIPAIQLLAIGWLLVTLMLRARAGIARWAPVGFGAVVVLVTIVLAFIVVPAQTGAAPFDSRWWASVPDLVVAVAAMLILSLVMIALMIAVVRRTPQPARMPAIDAHPLRG
nr:serine hydrolase domain-containing protein [Microbacterium thalassium]